MSDEVGVEAAPALVLRERIQLFASSPKDPRFRRPVDRLQTVTNLLVLLVASVMSAIAADLDGGFSDLAQSFPGFLRVVWQVVFWLAAGWSVALLVIAVVRHRARLTLEATLAAAIAIAIALFVGAIVTDDATNVVKLLFDSDGPPTYPPGALAICGAVIASFAPYITRPFRRFGRTLVYAQMVGALFLGVSRAMGVVASLSIGLLAGAIVHLIFGSPGGIPTVSRVRNALVALGVNAHELRPGAIRPEGAALLTGSDARGPIEVKIYGRDAWEGELLASLWRAVWYRGSRRSARLSRSEYVEHEGFMTYLADGAGLRVPEVVTAGVVENGDALIVVRPDGSALTEPTETLTVEQIDELWAELAKLHARRITHRRIDLDRVVTRDDGTAGFGDLSSASVESTQVDRLADRAQLLALTMLTSGREVAIERGEVAIGHDGLVKVLPHLQEAGLAPLVRMAFNKQDIELDDIRKELAKELDVPSVDLVQLRRVTWKTLLNVALLAVAAYTIVGLFADIDFVAFAEALRDASWWWLALALLVGQVPRFANAFSTMGSTMQPLPLGPTTALHFATCYINLAVPSSAGRIAITTRYFQRFGVPPATSLAQGVIDSVSGFVVQITMFSLIFFTSDVDLDLTVDTDELSGVLTLALIMVVAIIVAVLVVLLVPSIRRRVFAELKKASKALEVLRHPKNVLFLFGGNFMSELFFAITLGIAARGFGYELPLTTLILINTVVGLFAGLLPVPGGIGVAEAGLTLGLTRAGVPSDTAFAIALANRFCTFYLPPFWGFASYRWMIKKRYL